MKKKYRLFQFSTPSFSVFTECNNSLSSGDIVAVQPLFRPDFEQHLTLKNLNNKKNLNPIMGKLQTGLQ
jgi:hypothetical protein